MTKKPFRKTFLGTLITIGIICVVLYWVFFLSLGWFTGHGKEMTVPNVSGLQMEEAMKLLRQDGYAVDVDSTYDPEQQPLVVMEQQPKPGNTVKPGRTIYIKVNKVSPPASPMPNLVNLSYRSALLMLKNNKLLLGDTTMKPDVANGAVLEQLFNGNTIRPGEMIPQGSKIDLVVGAGLESAEIDVPDLVGLTYDMAIAVLSASKIEYDVIYEGSISDTMGAFVIYQLPEAYNANNEVNTISRGERIDIKIRQTPN